MVDVGGSGVRGGMVAHFFWRRRKDAWLKGREALDCWDRRQQEIGVWRDGKRNGLACGAEEGKLKRRYREGGVRGRDFTVGKLDSELNCEVCGVGEDSTDNKRECNVLCNRWTRRTVCALG